MAKPEDVVIDSMTSKELEELEELEKSSMRTATPDEERGYHQGFDRVHLTPKPF